jgi:hypothetical protein
MEPHTLKRKSVSAVIPTNVGIQQAGKNGAKRRQK